MGANAVGPPEENKASKMEETIKTECGVVKQRICLTFNIKAGAIRSPFSVLRLCRFVSFPTFPTLLWIAPCDQRNTVALPPW